MRYLFGFLCVCALGVVPLVGCSENGGGGGSGGTGGMGGGGTGGVPGCQSPEDCDDSNDCTRNACADGMCEYTPLADGTACDQNNECTTGMCADGECDTAPVQDGNPCGRETPDGEPRGGCYGGLCNFVPVSVTFGVREVVFDWSADQCEEFDIPDGPAKAVRASDGEIVLFGTIHETGNYLSRGNDFDSLEHDCAHPAHRSANLLTPESYENNEWLWSPYRVGAEWHVLIHNEFHDAVSINCSPSYLCWYNSITYAVSTDGARSFVKPSPPAHVVAPAPRVWIPPDTPVQDWYVTGYLTPSNIVLGPDGYYYALFHAILDLEDWFGACVMRSKTLDDPASWRAWDGSGFNLPMTSPYVTGTPADVCALLQTPTRPLMHVTDSLTYNTYLERYMLVSEWGYEVCGFYLSLSTDLIHWSDPQLIVEAPGGCASIPPGYPSIIDHDDATTNFEHPGQTPHLYFTQYHQYWLDRDLVRVPLTFTVEE